MVFTNHSKEPIGVWRDWCSWGWFCPEITIAVAGQKYLFTRIKRTWSRNYPDAYWIEPGDHYLLPVNLLGRSWVQPKDFRPDLEGVANVSCTFTLRACEATKRKGIWTGSVSVSHQLHLDISTEPRLPY